MMCGIPQDQQIPGTPCCTEEVTKIANQLWPLDFPGLCFFWFPFLTLGSLDVKKRDIISSVATQCMAPPGMTENQLKIEIAKLVSQNLR